MTGRVAAIAGGQVEWYGHVPCRRTCSIKMNTCRFCNHDVPEGSRFCPSYGHDLTPESEATASLSVRPDGDGSAGPRDVSPFSFVDSSHQGHYLSGTKIPNRHRIVSLVGKGCMVEVFQADDLKLGHTVALKF
jgi:hypothetical protein